MAVKVCPVATVAPPLAVMRPVAVKPLFTVVVPVEAPREIAVAAPPILRFVAPVLKRLPVALVVEIVPPLTPRLPAVVTLPVKVEVPSIVRLPFACRLPVLEIERPVEP